MIQSFDMFGNVMYIICEIHENAFSCTFPCSYLYSIVLYCVVLLFYAIVFGSIAIAIWLLCEQARTQVTFIACCTGYSARAGPDVVPGGGCSCITWRRDGKNRSASAAGRELPRNLKKWRPQNRTYSRNPSSTTRDASRHRISPVFSILNVLEHSVHRYP